MMNQLLELDPSIEYLDGMRLRSVESRDGWLTIEYIDEDTKTQTSLLVIRYLQKRGTLLDVYYRCEQPDDGFRSSLFEVDVTDKYAKEALTIAKHILPQGST